MRANKATELAKDIEANTHRECSVIHYWRGSDGWAVLVYGLDLQDDIPMWMVYTVESRLGYFVQDARGDRRIIDLRLPTIEEVYSLMNNRTT